MALGYLVVAILATITTVFAVQNADRTTISFLLWRYEGVPISALILGSLGAGLMLAGIPLWLSRWRLRSRTRTLETRVTMLETAVEERQRATLASPPRPPAPRT